MKDKIKALGPKKVAVAAIAAVVVVVCVIALAVSGDHGTYVTYSVPVGGKMHMEPAELAYKIDFPSLRSRITEDITSWLYIPGTNVNYPVLRPSEDKDTDFYLRRSYTGTYLEGGSIYMQKRNAGDYTSRDTVVYGHNMWAGPNAGSMFNTLHNYENKTFFDEHPYIYVYLPDKTLVYQIFAAYHNDDRLILDEHNDFKSDSEYRQYLTLMQIPGGRMYNCNPDLNVTVDDKILTLATCIRSDHNGRLLIIGKQLSDDEVAALDENELKEAAKAAGKGSNNLLLRYPPREP